MIKRKTFADAVKVPGLFGGSLKQKQWDGMNAILTEWEARGLTDLRWLAYMLATAKHETAHTMQPIAEYGRGRGRRYGVKGKHGQVAYGRGYVQLTWDYNYERADKELGLKGRLIKNYELALQPDIAAKIMFDGMIEGWFTKKKLSQYFSAVKDDPKNARQIINGNDKDAAIAAIHRKFLSALKAASEDEQEAVVEEDIAEAPDQEAVVEDDAAQAPALTSSVAETSVVNAEDESVEVEVLQRRLLARGYYEIGIIDKKMDSRLIGAIAGFKADRGVVPAVGAVDDILLIELNKAEKEKWKRPIGDVRASTTEAEAVEQAPEIKPVKQSRTAAFMAGIAAAITAAVNFISDRFQDALSWLVQVKDYLAFVPGWLWLVGLAGGFFYFWLQASKTVAGTVEAVKEGKRN